MAVVVPSSGSVKVRPQLYFLLMLWGKSRLNLTSARVEFVAELGNLDAGDA